MPSKLQQVGLTTSSQKTLNEMADRVDVFNRRNGELLVELDYFESPEHEREQTGRWRLLFTFNAWKDYSPNQIAKAFWMDSTE